jgi:hypothetical protein
MSCVKGESDHGKLYRDRADRQQIPVSTELFQQAFNDEQVTDIFRHFDNLKILGMLEEIPSRLRSPVVSIPPSLTSVMGSSNPCTSIQLSSYLKT